MVFPGDAGGTEEGDAALRSAGGECRPAAAAAAITTTLSGHLVRSVPLLLPSQLNPTPIILVSYFSDVSWKTMID